jgi:hypothetical protein
MKLAMPLKESGALESRRGGEPTRTRGGADQWTANFQGRWVSSLANQASLFLSLRLGVFAGAFWTFSILNH